MTKVTVLYPNKAGARFDAEYYVKVHMPMAVELLGAAIKGVQVDIGTGGAMPGQAPPFAAMCHFICESPNAFSEAFMPHAAALMGDIPNYTDLEAVIQVSEIQRPPQ